MNAFVDTATNADANADWQPSALASGVTDAGASGDKPIGAILSSIGRLDADKVEQVLAHQRAHGGQIGRAHV